MNFKLDEQGFTEYIAEAVRDSDQARSFRGFGVQVFAPLALRVSVLIQTPEGEDQEHGCQIDLSSYFSNYDRGADATECETRAVHAIFQSVEQVTGAVQSNGTTVPEWSEAKDKIMPRLVRRADVEPGGLLGQAGIAHRGFIKDTGIAIVYMLGDNMSALHVNEANLQTWQIDHQTLHAVAIENLRVYARKGPNVVDRNPGTGHRIKSRTGDPYASSLVLVPDEVSSWFLGEGIPICNNGKLIVAIPTCETFVVTEAHTLPEIASFTAMAMSIHVSAGPMALSPAVFGMHFNKVKLVGVGMMA